MTPPSRGGVIRVDKPPGPTSHDIVARARRALGVRRIGHTGTLDPFASGLLLLCVGPATRLAEYLTGLDKTYLATAVLGQSTDTDDLEGELVGVSEAWRELDESRVSAALSGFVGRIDQVPPAFSAKKVGGERMYRRARRGESVRLDAVPVQIREARVLDVDLPEVKFELSCSSGTYVRAVARDLGKRLGTGAHLKALRRTRIGPFAVTDAVSGDELHDADRVKAAWLEPAQALPHLPHVRVGAEEAARIRHGQAVPLEGGEVPEGATLAVLHDDELLCVATSSGGRVRPRKVFGDG